MFSLQLFSPKSPVTIQKIFSFLRNSYIQNGQPFRGMAKKKSVCGLPKKDKCKKKGTGCKSASKEPIIPLKEAKRFITDCLMAVGTPKKFAKNQARLLAEADIRGHFSHGMNRLEMYIMEIEAKVCDPCAVPCICQESPSTALVDGCNGLGSTIGIFSMKQAICKAMETGVGWVTAKNSNHNGIAAFYTMMAVREGLLAMAFTNSSPLLAPTRAKDAALGTNPISMGAPGKNGEIFLLDVATSAVALGKIEIAKRLGKPIPSGWAKDSSGQVTTDPIKAFEAKKLMPLGGTEANSGYKGSGLALMVEVFTGVTSGSHYGLKIKEWLTFKEKANLGQCYIAMNPACFGGGFEERLSDLMKMIRNLAPTDPKRPVMVPGDMEQLTIHVHKKQGGVIYSANQMETCKKLAKKLGVKPIRPKGEKGKPDGDKEHPPPCCIC